MWLKPTSLPTAVIIAMSAARLIAVSAGRPAVTGCRNSTAKCAASQLEPPLPMLNSRPGGDRRRRSPPPPRPRRRPFSAKKRSFASMLSRAFWRTDSSTRAHQLAGILLLAVQERIQARAVRGSSRHRRISDAGPHRLHLGLRLAQFVQQCQRARRLGLVDAAHREADMHQHPFADTGIRRPALDRDEADIDRPPHAADIDDRQVVCRRR